MALRLEVQEVNGRKWYRLLGSDGTSGWTTKAFTTMAAKAKPATERFGLMSLSPDDQAFDSASEVSVPQEALGDVLGGSRTSWPAYPQDMMVPERLSRSIGPWLKLKFASSVVGFAAPDWVSLEWQHAGVTAGSVPAILDTLGFSGMVRRPFLGPAKEVLKTVAPPPGTTVGQFPAALGPLASAVSPWDWNEPELALCNPDTKARGILTVVAFSRGNSRMFTFLHSDGKSSYVWMKEDAPFVSGAEMADLDGDGKAEWLLEVVHTYGDGYYSTLWLVGGKESPGRLQVERLPLSHSSGEPGASAVDASWWAGPDGRIWVVTAENQTTMASFTYQGGLVRSSESTSPMGLVVLFNGVDYNLAAENQLKLAQSGETAGLFPMRSADALHWVVARPFDRLQEARDWAKEKSHVPAEVVALPRTK